MIHLEECCVERGHHAWVLTDLEGDVVASIPFELAADSGDAALVLEQVAKGYNAGHEDGQVCGKYDLQRDIRKLLGAATVPQQPS